jgi:hypothetical protein
MAITGNDLIGAALAEIRVKRAGEDLDPHQAALALLVLNELLDAWNITPRAIFSTTISTFTLTPSLQPHTIGVTSASNTPTFGVTVARPSRIQKDGANLILDNDIHIPVNVRDHDWWMNVRARSVTSDIPTDLYYDPSWPNGSIYLWPVPTSTYDLELAFDTLLSSVADGAADLDLPQGYQQAVRLTLAELLAPMFGQTASASTMKAARAARLAIFGANTTSPDLITRDAGQPGRGGGGFNFLTGNVS